MEDKICAWEGCKARLPHNPASTKYCPKHSKEARKKRSREAYRLQTRCAHSTHVYHRKYCYVLQPMCAYWDGWTKAEYNQYKNYLPKGTEVRFA